MKKGNRVALVTGAAVRVGRSVALRLASAGYDVAVHYRSSAKAARELSAAICAGGGRAADFRADLARLADVRRLVAGVEKRLGPIGLLVNSASVFKSIPFLSVTERDWDKTISANLKSVFFLSQEVAKRMLRRKTAGRVAGVIVNIEDVAVYRPYARHAPYLVSKAGVAMLTRLLARELGPDIRVCGVAPGPVLLPENFSPAERKKAVRRTALKREGSAEDVAAAVQFLAVEAKYTTGTTLFVDGGRMVSQ